MRHGFWHWHQHHGHPHHHGEEPAHMADNLETTTPRLLKVDGRDPFADEAISVSDPSILSVALQGDGTTLVTGLADGVATITVSPGSEDVNRTAGSDDVTVTTPVPPTPLVVTLA